MALFDLPLDALRDYRPEVAEPADLEEFWEETLSRARQASPPLIALEQVPNGLTLVDTWDVTFAGHDGSGCAAGTTAPPGSSRTADRGRVPGVRGRARGAARAPGLDRGRVRHLVMDSRGQGSAGAPAGTPPTRPAPAPPPRA